jgi:predicted tellurium resistance membrane protein TerC
MHWITDPHAWMGLITLVALEIVLGIDNVIFISISAGNLPKRRQARARVTGLGLAMISRICLLFTLTWVMRLTEPLLTVLGNEISARDLILIGGGLFLLVKSTLDIHGELEGKGGRGSVRVPSSYAGILVQIVLLDIIFSFDSVLTAIGMVEEVFIMIIAIVIAVIFMMFASGIISRYIKTHPTLKVLALSFLFLIGIVLIADGLGQHIPKGYIYFSLAFSTGVEMINLRLRKRRTAKAKR